jgi:hypothetical protein
MIHIVRMLERRTGRRVLPLLVTVLAMLLAAGVALLVSGR